MRTLFIIPIVLISLVSLSSWADHIQPLVDFYQKPYNERCVINGVFKVEADCLCEKLTNGVCMKYASEAKYKRKLLKDLHDADITKQAREKLCNKFINLYPVFESNSFK